MLDNFGRLSGWLSRRERIVYVIAHAFLAAAVCTSCNSPASAGVIDDAKASLQRYYDSIAAIEVQYDVIRSGTVAGHKITPDGKPCEPLKYHWIKQGECELLTLEAWRDPERQQETYRKLWLGFDGRRFCNVLFNPRRPEEVQSVHANSSIQHREMDDEGHVGIVAGLHLWGSHLSLQSLMKRGRMSHLGTESIGGQDCEVVDFGEYEGFSDWVYRAKLWLDLQHDFLPKKLELGIIRNAKTGELSPPLAWRGEVAEFIQADDPASSRKRWFPKRATVLGSELIVQNVRFNQPVETKRFVPELPAGTTIQYLDETERLGDSDVRIPKTEITGGEEGRKLFLARAERQKEENRVKRAQIIADLQSSSRNRWLWWGSGIFAATILGFLLFRSSRR